MLHRGRNRGHNITLSVQIWCSAIQIIPNHKMTGNTDPYVKIYFMAKSLFKSYIIQLSHIKSVTSYLDLKRITSLLSITNIVAKDVNQIGWFILIKYKECCTVFCRHVIERWKLMTNLHINYYLIICIYMYNYTQGKKFNQSIWVNYHLRASLHI